MKKILITAILLATASFYAQVGIGTTNPEGALDVVSTNSSIVVPRVANTAAITTPINGMIIYDLSSNCFKGYNNGFWTDCGFTVPAAVVESILAQVGNEGDDPDTLPSVITAAQLASVPGVTGVVPANQTAYQAYIDANPTLFSAPATQAQVQAMIDAVNASQSILAQVGNEGDAPNTVPSIVTVAQINTISPAVTGAIVANQTAYQAYIDANPTLFSAPATQAQVQAMIAAVSSNGTAVVSSYSCNTASAGTMTNGTAVSGVTQTITATVTTVGTYSISTTANGVTFAATGTFAGTGAQNIVLTATGTPTAAGTNAFALNTTPGCSFDRTTNAPTPSITSTTGKIWMDRNLGATRVATSVTDNLAYGDLYQWGRKADGHEKMTWTNGTTGAPVNGTTSVNADIPANNLFILEPNSPFDWRETQDNNLWTGVAAVNNPCPAGFRVPTNAEISAEVTAYSITNSATAFNSPLKFTVPGYRDVSGDLSFVGSGGNYWSSSVSGTSATYRFFNSGIIYVGSNGRASGLTVRCIKD